VLKLTEIGEEEGIVASVAFSARETTVAEPLAKTGLLLLAIQSVHIVTIGPFPRLENKSEGE